METVVRRVFLNQREGSAEESEDGGRMDFPNVLGDDQDVCMLNDTG